MDPSKNHQVQDSLPPYENDSFHEPNPESKDNAFGQFQQLDLDQNQELKKWDQNAQSVSSRMPGQSEMGEDENSE